MNSKAEASTIPQLTSLRFFAAFGILILHYRDFLGDIDQNLLTLVVGGRVGVTFFFVLSGFILTYNYESTFKNLVVSKDFWRFQKFRFARIYPTYLLALCLDTPVHLMLKRVGENRDYWLAWFVNALGVQSWVPLEPYVLFWNTPSWSISTEFFFYLCFPFVCNFLARAIRTVPKAFYLATFIVFITIATNIYVETQMLAYDNTATATAYALQNYLPPIRISEFIIGCIAGRLFLENKSTPSLLNFLQTRRQRDVILAVLSALSLVLIFRHEYDGPELNLWILDQSSRWHILFAIPFAIMILAIASGKTALSKILENRVLVLLGESSYALYITHYAGTIMRQHVFWGDKRAIVSIFCMLWSIAYSVAIFLLFEQPLRKRLRKLKFFGAGH